MRSAILYLLLVSCAQSQVVLTGEKKTKLPVEASWRLESPSGNLCIELELVGPAEDREPKLGSLFYRIAKHCRGREEVLVERSPLGLRRDDQDFVDRLLFEGSDTATVDERYTLLHGKRRRCRNRGKEMTLRFRNSQGARVQLVARAFDDGIAFRYRFPERDISTRRVLEEVTGFRIPQGSVAFIQPHQEVGKYAPAYESFYQRGVAVGTPSPTKAGWSFPALFRIGGRGFWLLVSEAAVDRSYAGSRLAGEAPGGLYRIRLPDAGEGNGTGQVEPRSSLPWSTPWRVLFVGSSLESVVESTLITDLSPPSTVADTSWVRPGRVSWSWWSDPESPRDAEKLRPFIDLAAEMGWEYTLVDAGRGSSRTEGTSAAFATGIAA